MARGRGGGARRERRLALVIIARPVQRQLVRFVHVVRAPMGEQPEPLVIHRLLIGREPAGLRMSHPAVLTRPAPNATAPEIW
jgi:hypothetical protein